MATGNSPSLGRETISAKTPHQLYEVDGSQCDTAGIIIPVIVPGDQLSVANYRGNGTKVFLCVSYAQDDGKYAFLACRDGGNKCKVWACTKKNYVGGDYFHHLKVNDALWEEAAVICTLYKNEHGALYVSLGGLSQPYPEHVLAALQSCALLDNGQPEGLIPLQLRPGRYIYYHPNEDNHEIPNAIGSFHESLFPRENGNTHWHNALRPIQIIAYQDGQLWSLCSVETLGDSGRVTRNFALVSIQEDPKQAYEVVVLWEGYGELLARNLAPRLYEPVLAIIEKEKPHTAWGERRGNRQRFDSQEEAEALIRAILGAKQVKL